MPTVTTPTTIVELLSTHRKEIADRWARELFERGGDNYRRLSVGEIGWWTTRGLDAVIDALSSPEARLLHQHLRRVSATRRRLGFEIGEVVGGLLMLNEIVLPLANDFRDIATAVEQLGRLDACMRRAVATFGQLFAGDSRRSLQHEKDRLALLLDASRESAESLDLETISRRVARFVGLALEADWSCVMLEPGVASRRQPRAVVGDPVREVFGDSLPRAIELRLTDLRRTVASTNEPAVLRASPHHPFFAEFPQLACVADVPIVLRERVLAHVVGVAANDGRARFGKEQLRLASGIARIVAPAIAHADLYADSLRDLAEGRTLQRLSSAILDQTGIGSVFEIVCREIQSLTGAAGSAVLLEEHGRLRTAFSTGDAADWADRLLHENTLTEGAAPVEPVLVNQLRIGDGRPARNVVSSLLAVPLRVRGETIGFVQLVNKPPGFDEDDLRLVDRVAEHVALTIEHTRLHAQQERMAVLEERQRLARDLHDSVTQSIYGVSVLSEATARLIQANQPEAAVEHCRELRQASLKALRELRHMIFELRPPDLEKLGLVAALETRLATVEGRAGLKTELHCEGMTDLPFAVSDGLYRIANEAFANSVRHAQASRISLRLERREREVVLEILDDGTGFDIDAGRSGGGFGLSCMEERAKRMGGTFAVQTERGRGTRIRVSVPVADPAASAAEPR